MKKLKDRLVICALVIGVIGFIAEYGAPLAWHFDRLTAEDTVRLMLTASITNLLLNNLFMWVAGALPDEA